MTFALIVDDAEPVIACSVLIHALKAHRVWLGAKLAKERSNEMMRTIYTVEIEQLDKLLDTLADMAQHDDTGDDLV